MNKLLLEMSEQHLHDKTSAGKQQASDFIACINETTRGKRQVFKVSFRNASKWCHCSKVFSYVLYHLIFSNEIIKNSTYTDTTSLSLDSLSIMSFSNKKMFLQGETT
jgi:hypothetical protein